MKLEQRPRTTLLWCLLALSPAAWGQAARIMDSISVARTTTHINVLLLFNCRARYVAQEPGAGAAEQLRVRLLLAPDCATAASLQSETLAVTADRDVLRSVELVPSAGPEVDVEIRWVRTERAVVVPTADQQGLRVRLLRPGRQGDETRVVISEPAGDLTTAYAVNLESALQPFSEAAVRAAASSFGLPVYVSQVTIDDVLWYRLRIGPLPARAQADRVLLAAQAKYPRAWLAIADETLIDSPQAADDARRTPPPTARPRPTTVDAATEALLAAARERLRRKDYATSIELLTKYLAAPAAARAAEARELLGLTRERNGQLAHAKAEYESFLREFPDDARTGRVQRRLRALRSAALAGRTGADAERLDDLGWRGFGGIAQFYRRDSNRIETGDVSRSFIGQNSLLTDIDGVLRRRGLDSDTTARFSGGYVKDLSPRGPGDQVRISSAFVELAGRDRLWSARLGRQSRSTGGVLGVFDGAYGSYQLEPHLILDAAVGAPVETTRAGPSFERLFQALSIGFGVFGDAFEPALYVVNQSLAGEVDRRAVGAELRYFRPGRVFVGFADYDVYFHELNSAVLIGTLQLPARWTLNLDLERRRNPVLTTRNALIGQPVDSLGALLDIFSASEVQQLAADRTARTQLYGLALSRPIAERLQFTFNASSSETGATRPSGGVEGIPTTGREVALSAQLLAASVMRTGDLTGIGLRWQQGGTIEAASLSIISRVPLWSDWRLRMQLRADQRRFTIDDSEQTLYSPSIGLSLQVRKALVELDAGAEFASRDLLDSQEDISRYFFSLGYRWSF